MKKVIVLRHGDVNPTSGLLTSDALMRLDDLGEQLRRELALDGTVRLYSSPEDRAIKSAVILASWLGIAIETRVEIGDRILLHADRVAVERLIRKDETTTDAVILVTHAGPIVGIVSLCCAWMGDNDLDAHEEVLREPGNAVTFSFEEKQIRHHVVVFPPSL